MYIEDKDLSIQEVCHLIHRIKVAQQKLALMSQEQIDTIKVVAKACYDQRERLAKWPCRRNWIWQDKSS